MQIVAIANGIIIWFILTGKRFSRLLWLLTLALLLAACQPAPAPSSDAGLRVVATFSILGDWVSNVAGEEVQLRTLVGPDGDAHTFEPTPADAAALAESDLIIENGLQFEPWLNDLYQSSGSTATRMAAAAGLDPLPAGEGEFDPHVWHDVTLAMRMVEAIRDALVQADPQNAELYRANAESYLAELRSLDQWVQEQVQTLPPERRKLVTSHDTFQYFAGRYGFTILGAALGVTTETADPSASEIASLVEEIRAAGVPAVFVENVSNPGLMERIASEAGVAVGPPLYTDALGPPGSQGESYVRLIEYNVTSIVEALTAGL